MFSMVAALSRWPRRALIVATGVPALPRLVATKYGRRASAPSSDRARVADGRTSSCRRRRHHGPEWSATSRTDTRAHWRPDGMSLLPLSRPSACLSPRLADPLRGARPPLLRSSPSTQTRAGRRSSTADPVRKFMREHVGDHPRE